jgi:hypothetical protein
VEEFTMKWWLFGIGVVLGLAYSGSDGLAAKERAKAEKGQPTPQTIKVADLAANGPGDNPHVTLTDFEFRPNDVVVSRKRRLFYTYKEYEGVSFPLYPRGRRGKRPQKQAARVVVMAPWLRTDAEIEIFMRRKTITGMITDFGGSGTQEKPVWWSVEGRLPELAWFVGADEKPSSETALDPDEILRRKPFFGAAALVFLGASAVAFARGGKRRGKPVS